MVYEEKLVVLRLIQEGKISAEEGLALMEALESGEGLDAPATAEPEPTDDTEAPGDSGYQERFEDMREEAERRTQKVRDNISDKTEALVGRIEKAAQRIADDVNKGLQKLGKDVGKWDFDMSNVKSWLSSLNLEGLGRHQEFEESISGTFAPEVDQVRLEVGTRNGAVHINTWDGPGYRVDIVKRIGGSEEEARRRAADLVTIVQAADSLSVKSQEKANEAVIVHIRVPRDKTYRLDVRGENGKVDLGGLDVSEGDITTHNGSILVVDCSGRRLQLTTTNGGIRSESLVFDELVHKTTNGSIQLRGAGATLVCQTTNGSIKLGPVAAERLASFDECQYSVTTTNGSVRVEFDTEFDRQVMVNGRSSVGKVRLTGEWQTESESKGLVGNRVQAHSVSPDGAPRINLDIQTVNGSITVDRESNDQH